MKKGNSFFITIPETKFRESNVVFSNYESYLPKVAIKVFDYQERVKLKTFDLISRDDEGNISDKWLRYLEGVNFHHEGLVEKLHVFSQSFPSEVRSLHSDTLMEKVSETLNHYLAEMHEENDGRRKYPSEASLFQFFRYVHEIPATADVYIDSDSGFIGVSLRAVNGDRLSLIVKDNKEIIYSLISKGEGVSKFSGRGFIGKNKDSRKIRKIIGMVYE